jgi:competence protein ComEC
MVGELNTLGEAGRRAGWCAAVALWLRLAPVQVFTSPDGGGDLALHFLDVGQGDGAVLRTPGGRWLAIDAGPASGGRTDAGRRVVAPFLERQGVRALAAILISHAHADHMGGVPALLRRFGVGLVLEPGASVPDPAYGALLAGLDSSGIAWHPARAGERFTLDGVRFSVLHPRPGWAEWGEDVNEDSVVLLVEYGGFQALFTGDAGFPAEAALRGSVGPVDLLKVGHHGSRGSTSGELLDSLRPLAAVISVGRNDYGHPSPETLARLERRRVPVLRTDEDGTISVRTSGTTMWIRSRRGEQVYPLTRGD